MWKRVRRFYEPNPVLERIRETKCVKLLCILHNYCNVIALECQDETIKNTKYTL